jgi:transcriptional regulator with PAS, ATPase and Fis domain
MMQARGLARSGLLEFLCRPARDADRAAALHAAASACLSVPTARRAWAKLGATTAEASGDRDGERLPYGAEVPIDLGGETCGTVGLETDAPVDGPANERAAAVAELLATWEARRRLGVSPNPQAIVGCSAEMRRAEYFARRYAGLEEPVLIQGETGVGKELIAQTLHRLSPRRDEPLGIINCAAVPDELIASELFGHRRGAFTGAVRDQRGRFVIADGATLFLDEIGEMGPNLQAALLRVLEYGEVQRLGDEGQMRRINVRVIAATNRDLTAEVDGGRFRSDLYYRIAALTIEVPPLRQRPEDIPVLARHFASVLEERWGQSLEIVARALNGLIAYPFPGNVRELRNLVLRAATTCLEGRIEAIALPDLVAPFAERRPLRLAAVGNGATVAHVKHGVGFAAGVGQVAPPPHGKGMTPTLPKGDAQGAAGGNGVTTGRDTVGSYVPSSGNGRLPANGNGDASSASGSRPRDGAGNAGIELLSRREGDAARQEALSLDGATAAHLRRVLTMAEGNISQAARMLDIPRTTLQSKLRRYGVQ